MTTDPQTIRLTAAQATVLWLTSQHVVVDGSEVPYFAGAWAIFGHGNVAAMGEALHAAGDALPTFRAHNEQGMAHAAIAYAKQMRRRRAMVCTTSIGPGATNLVTAAALAFHPDSHVGASPELSDKLRRVYQRGAEAYRAHQGGAERRLLPETHGKTLQFRD